MVYLYWTPLFYTKLTHLTQKLKKLRLVGTCGAKLDPNWIPIWNLIGFSLNFTYYYIYRFFVWLTEWTLEKKIAYFQTKCKFSFLDV